MTFQIKDIEVRDYSEKLSDPGLNYKDRQYLRKQLGIKARVYISVDSESILEDFGNRAVRPWTLYKKEVMPTVMRKLGFPGWNKKFRWSQKAGCSCGCSPGFILTEVFGKDIWVTVTGPKRVDTEEATAVAANRIGQLVKQL